LVYPDLLGVEKAVVIGPDESGRQTGASWPPGVLVWPVNPTVEADSEEEEAVTMGPVEACSLEVLWETLGDEELDDGNEVEDVALDWRLELEDLAADCRMLPLATRTTTMKTTEAAPARTVRSLTSNLS